MDEQITIYSSVEPTTRPDGSELQPDDLWVDDSGVAMQWYVIETLTSSDPTADPNEPSANAATEVISNTTFEISNTTFVEEWTTVKEWREPGSDITVTIDGETYTSMPPPDDETDIDPDTLFLDPELGIWDTGRASDPQPDPELTANTVGD